MKLNRFYKIVLAALFSAQNFPAVAQTNDTSAPVDYSTFSKFIAQRNIFDPNRLPNVPYNPRRTIITPRVLNQADSFSLVGVIGYGEGQLAGVYAFFDGSNFQYQKSAQLNDSIAIFKISAITADSVTLLYGTNTLVLGIGEQLHDAGGGHWVFANGTTVGYNSLSGYSSGRNNRSGFGNGGRRRNNNFGNGNNGNGNFNNGNLGRRRNNFGTAASPLDNSQAQDPNMVPDDNAAPDNNGAVPEDNAAPDAGAQDNTAVPQAEQSAAPSGDLGDPLTILKQKRQAELQQTGH
jgi:hypothetical protein